MASHPPSDCCLKATFHEGTPAGENTKIAGVESYVTGDKTCGKLILMTSDIFGLPLVNNKLICDAMAHAGFYVVMPDLFEGEPVPCPPPQGFDILNEWLPKHHPDDTVNISNAVLDELVKELKPSFVSTAGYCYGAKVSAKMMTDKSKMHAAAFAHPSFVTEEEVAAIETPLFIAAAETDNLYTEENRAKTEKILKDNKVPYFTTLASGCEHGFAVKGDLSIPAVKFAKEKCCTDFIQWFKYWSA